MTRATVITRFVRSKRIADFATVGRLELSVSSGLNAKGDGEILLRFRQHMVRDRRRVKGGWVNEELFGWVLETAVCGQVVQTAV